MADKIKKFLARLSPQELNRVLAVMYDIENNDIDSLDIKPLKGQKHTYRVRKGRVRIIFYSKNEKVVIISVSNRDDQTYSGF
jgi:mRNA-degrading endonuclease RelE of RelBE toxin-antitoxin system